MASAPDSVGRHPFAWFLAVTFGTSWSAWLLQYSRPEPMDLPGLSLLFLGGLGPFLGAVFVNGLTDWGSFRADLTRFRVPISRYLVVVGLPLGMAIGFVLVFAGIQGQTLASTSPHPLGIYPGMFISGIIFGGLEEPGWRGFAQRSLQRRFTWLTASLLVGLLWVLWHVPLFLIPGTTQASLPFASFALLGVGLSILFARIYNWAMLSIPVLILLHGGFNAAQGWSGIFETGQIVPAMTSMVLIVWGIALVALVRPGTHDAREPAPR